MKVVVIGAGQVGSNLARYLSSSGKEVVLVEQNAELCARLDEDLDVNVVQGSGTNPDTLRDVGLTDTDLLVAVTDSDETNMMCVFVAAPLLRENATKMARLRSPQYVRDEELQRRFRVDVVINPDDLLADKVIRLLNIPGARDVLKFEGGKVIVVAFPAVKGGRLVGQSMEKLGRQTSHLNMMVAAILRRPARSLRRQKVIIPGGQDTIQEDDLVYFITTRDMLDTLADFLCTRGKRAKSVLLGGGSKISFHLARRLSKEGISTRMMIADRDAARKASEELEKVVVLNQNATNLERLGELLEEGVDTYIAADEREETNVLTSLAARRLGVPRSVTVTHTIEYMHLIKAVDVDIVLNPFQLAAAYVLRHVHQVNVLEANVFGGDDAEAFELVPPRHSPLIGMPLKKLKMPAGSLVALIVRSGESIIPHGNDTIEPHDRIIVFCRRGAVPALERLIDPRVKD